MSDQLDIKPADPDQNQAYDELTTWNVEFMQRFDLNTTRQSYNLPLANALNEFDPFYCPPDQEQESKPKSKKSATPIVNLPPPRIPSERTTFKPFPVNKGENKDDVKGFTRPRASVSLGEPKFQIPAKLLQNKDVYAVLPVGLRGSSTQEETSTKGRFDTMMQALDETRKDLAAQAKSEPNSSSAEPGVKHPVLAEALPITLVKQVSRFGTTTSKITPPSRDWISAEGAPETPKVPAVQPQPFSFVTPKTERILPPHMQIPDTPESPLANRGLQEDDLQYNNAVEVVRQTVEGKGVPAGSTKYLLITGIDRNLDPVILRERVSQIADVKALVYRYQEALGAIVVLLHSAKDASKVEVAVSKGGLNLQAGARSSRFHMSSTSSDAEDARESRAASCHGLAAGAFAGKGVMRYLNECESRLRIRVEKGDTSGSAQQFLQTLLEEVGPLRLFVPDQTIPNSFLVSYEDIRDNEYVSQELPELELQGYQFSVSDYPTLKSRSPIGSPSKPAQKFQLPQTPPDSGRKRSIQLPSHTREFQPHSKGPWRSPSRDALPVTPAPRNTALEKMLQAGSPRADLLAAVRDERRKWDAYELALVSTPLSRNTLQLFRTAQDGIPSPESRTGQTPLTASKLVSFNSMKSPHNVKRTDWFASALKTEKGQDSIRYKQEVPIEYRFSLERIQRGLDSRTTVMIKDIPNKLSRDQLIDAIQEVVPGGITFVYLRFDWEFQCNVAYGFVNFRTLNHLEEFARHRLGQKWGLYMSDKVLQMSYATIQGHDNLVNHFRNSTVMHATPEWRPVVINTAGRIDCFPPPNRGPNGQYITERAHRTVHEAYEWEDAGPHSL